MRACKIIASRSCADAPPALRSTYISLGGVCIHGSGRWPKASTPREPVNNYGPVWKPRTIEYRCVPFPLLSFYPLVLSLRRGAAGVIVVERSRPSRDLESSRSRLPVRASLLDGETEASAAGLFARVAAAGDQSEKESGERRLKGADLFHARSSSAAVLL